MNRRKYAVLITAIMVTASLPIMISPAATTADFSANQEFQVVTTVSFETIEPEPLPAPASETESVRKGVNWFVPVAPPEQEAVRAEPEELSEEEVEPAIELEPIDEPESEPEMVAPEAPEPSEEKEGSDEPSTP